MGGSPATASPGAPSPGGTADTHVSNFLARRGPRCAAAGAPRPRPARAACGHVCLCAAPRPRRLPPLRATAEPPRVACLTHSL